MRLVSFSGSSACIARRDFSALSNRLFSHPVRLIALHVDRLEPAAAACLIDALGTQVTPETATFVVTIVAAQATTPGRRLG